MRARAKLSVRAHSNAKACIRQKPSPAVRKGTVTWNKSSFQHLQAARAPTRNSACSWRCAPRFETRRLSTISRLRTCLTVPHCTSLCLTVPYCTLAHLLSDRKRHELQRQRKKARQKAAKAEAAAAREHELQVGSRVLT
eukprot:6198885-Pleurochrysis_carterae.AAC.4